MKLLRRLPTRQLLALCVAVVAIVSGATALALATTGGGPKPAPMPLASAVHDALTAPQVKGVSARIQFTNHLIDSSSIQGSNPIISGATGRFWATSDGRARLELQASSSRGTGDAQVLVNGNQVSVYDSGSNTVYKGTLPAHKGSDPKGDSANEQPPSVAEIQKQLTRLAEHAIISGANPTDVAGQPTYTVRVSPKHDGGLLGGAEIAWDSVNGTPLRAAVYASGSSSPVLELKATDITFGPVSSSVFDVQPPANAKVTDLTPPSGHSAGDQGKSAPVTGLAAVQQKVSFPVAAPDTLAGLPRGEVRLIESGKNAGALVTYGQGLGGIAVLETPADSKPGATGTGGPGGQLQLPKVSINGVPGEELDTALGTIIRFQRGGVQYVVAGSVPPAAAEAAARAL